MMNFGWQDRERMKENKKRTRLQQMMLIIVLMGVLFYPFIITGILFCIPIIYYQYHDKKVNGAKVDYQPILQKYFSTLCLGALILFGINALLFALMMPRAYFSAYEWFPLHQIGSPLTFDWSSLPALVMGGIGAAFMELCVFIFLDKQRIEPIEKRRERIQKSKDYNERRKNRMTNGDEINEDYEKKYQYALEHPETKEAQEILTSIYFGKDEYGGEVFIPEKEFNYHGLSAGSTGVGKTTLLQIFFDHCARKKRPALIIDGKGDPATKDAVEKFAKKHNRPLRVFSDENDLRYNPFKYGNSVVIRDKAIGLAESESKYYSSGAEQLIQLTVQLLDRSSKLKRDFPTFSKLLNPQNVLKVFEQEIDWENLSYEKIYQKHKNKVDQFEEEMEAKDEKNLQEETQIQHGRGIAGRASARQSHMTAQPEQAEVIKMMLKKMPSYQRIKFLKEELSEELQALFYNIFEKYEASENGIQQLYVKSDNLVSNVDLLLNSEIGYLYDTTDSEKDELDLIEVDANNEIIYVALNGLIYQKFISSLAFFLIGDINYLASYRYRQIKKEKEKNPDFEMKPMFLFADEPASYITENFVDTVNKTRGAGIHTIFTPQTFADLDAVDPNISRMIVGNTNTYFLGRINDPKDAEYAAKLIGTYSDIEMTEVITQEDGYGNMNRTSWTGDKGTKKEVMSFKIKPDTIKELKQSEFILYRKASKEYTEPRKVYIRKP
ncbi:TraM recognition domain-containing protein [Listeria kieliensis]